MKHGFERPIRVVLGGILAAVLSWVGAAAQTAPPVSLQEQLNAQYQLAKMGRDSNGPSVVEPGTVLTIQKGGILGVSQATVVICPAKYQDGNLNSPKGICATAVNKSSRLFKVGENVYPTKIDVNLQNDKIEFFIVACDSCKNTDPPTYYKSEVSFQFAKGSLAKADASQIEDTIGQVLSISNEADAQQGENAQGEPGQVQSQAEPPQQSEPQTTQAGKFVLDDGTPIKLRLNQDLSSADAKTGDNVDFEVLEELKIGELVAIPKGSTAHGTVTDAEHKKSWARGGKLDIRIDYVNLADGEKAALRGVRETKGSWHTVAMPDAMDAGSLVAWPAAPIFLLMHGKDVSIPKGTEITAYVKGKMALDSAQFAPVASPASDVAAPTAVPSQSSPTSAQLDITSNPVGAEIAVDGNFVGDTPSELAIAAGDHTITISKHGYKPWKRKLTVSDGKITVSAELER
jgi:hypothetical protein